MLAIADIESTEWSNYRTAAVVTEAGDIDTYDALPALARRIEGHNGKMGSHWGGSFDFSFLGPPRSLKENPNSGSISKARYGRATLWDTRSLLPTSVEAIGRSVGLRKFAHRSDRIADIPLHKVREHAIRDAQIVLRGVLAHRQALAELAPGLPTPTSAGGTAIRALEVLDPELVEELGAHDLTPDEWREHRHVFSGDRSEVWWIGYRPSVSVFDINSSFPFSWLEAPIPVGPWRAVDAEDPLAPWAVYWCERITQPRDRLPVVQADGMWRHDGSGYVTSEELVELRAIGGEVQIRDGWVSERVMPLGRNTVDWLYGHKVAGVPWAKGALVSMHGKTIQGITGGTWHLQGSGRYEQERVLTWPEWYQRPLLGLALYSRPRIRLWRVLDALLRAGWEIYYAKADSVHTNCPPSKFPGTIGKAIGQFKVEARRAEGLYCGHGLYGLREGGEVSIASTGISPNAVAWSQLEQVAAGKEIEVESAEGLEGWRTRALHVGPRRARRRMTLRIQTAGKLGRRGLLRYPD